jgi:Polyketide cyclase / dehydrase and lipid transport
MAANDYRFVTRWRLQARIEEIAEILAEPLDLPRWWPAVFLDAREIEPGGAGGIGRVIELFTTGFLPYTLRWRFRVVERDPPRRFALAAMGDFSGQGVWTLSQRGGLAEVTYTWSIRAQKPLLRLGSFLLRPVFAANHRWAMKQGERSLALEVRRRRGEADVGAPPQRRRLRRVRMRS